MTNSCDKTTPITVRSSGRNSKWSAVFCYNGGRSVTASGVLSERLRVDRGVRRLYVELREYRNNSPTKQGERYPCIDEEVDYGSSDGSANRTDPEGSYNGAVNSKRKRFEAERFEVVSAKKGKSAEARLGSVHRCYNCCGPKCSSQPTKCCCLHLSFHRSRFQDVLVILDQLKDLRLLLSAAAGQVESCRKREAFHAVFGVTNTPMSDNRSSGTRGLFYYFHDRKEAGSFCNNAMYVLLGKDTWTRFCRGFVSDPVRQRCYENKEETKGGMVRGTDDGGLFVGKETHWSYSRVDLLVGYSVFLRTRMTGHNPKQQSVTRTSLIRCVVESGLYQQPSVPSEGARKPASARLMMEFLDCYDNSSGARFKQVDPYFHVCNPSLPGGYLFEPSCSSVLAGCDYPIVSLGFTDGMGEVAKHLDDIFLLRYGPDGSKVVGEGHESLRDVEGGSGCMVWSAGEVLNNSLGDILSERHMECVGEMLRPFFDDVVLSWDARKGGSSKEFIVHTTVAYKMNRLMEGSVRMQMAHLLMEPTALANVSERVLIVRGIVPLDKAGLALRLWPDGKCPVGAAGKDKIVYVGPGTMLLVPASVPIGDCLRFSSQGQRRAEFLFAVHRREDAFPREAMKVGGELHYLQQNDAHMGAGNRSRSVAASDGSPYWNPGMTAFLDVFRF